MYETLEDFIYDTCMDKDMDYPVYVWDTDNEETIYNGTMDEIPEHMLNATFVNWEFDPFTGRIGFNVSDVTEDEGDDEEEE